MIKLPPIPPAFLLNIQLNSNVCFSTSFGSLEDLVDDTIWQVGCERLHDSLLKWLEREAERAETAKETDDRTAESSEEV